MKKKILSVFTQIFTTALIAVLLSALFLNISTLWTVDKIQRGESVTGGYFCAIIGSGSMEPTVSVNDLLFIKGSTLYQAEEIITFVSRKGSLITHRVKEVSNGGYITQGDANNIPDNEITKQRVLGKVVFVIPGIGGIIDGIISPVGTLFLTCIFMLIFLIQRIRRPQNEDEHSFDDPYEN